MPSPYLAALWLALFAAPCFTQGWQAFPGARMASVSWVDLDGKFWLFGGYGFSNVTSMFNPTGLGVFNDLWRYDPLLDEWTWVRGSHLVNQLGVYGTRGEPSTFNSPGARQQAISWMGSDGTLWLFGGVGYSNSSVNGNLNDLWRYNPSTEQWTWMGGTHLTQPYGVYGTQGVASPSNTPGSRVLAVSWVGVDGSFWLFGGSGSGSAPGVGALNDLWQHNPATNEWTWIGGNGTVNQPGVYGTQGIPSIENTPGARFFSPSWTDSEGTFWLFGGTTNGGLLNDLWNYNGSTNEWTWILGNNTLAAPGVFGAQGLPTNYSTPGARRDSRSWVSNGALWLFGGWGFTNSSQSGFLNDLWRYNLATMQWTWMGGSFSVNDPGEFGTQGVPSLNNIPRPRQNAASWTGSDGTLWLFGGGNLEPGYGFAYINDLWKYNIATGEWTWVGGSKVSLQFGVYVTPSLPSPLASNPAAEVPQEPPFSPDNVVPDIASIVVPAVVVPLVVAGIIVGVLLGLRRKKQKENKQTDNPLSQLSSPDKRLIPYKSVTLEKEIGAGSFGKVYLGKWQATKVAVKIGNATISTADFLKEAEFQMSIPPHPNIVQLLGISTDGPQPLVILEYCNNGSLDNLLFDSTQPISTAKQIHIANSIAKGLYHLHENNIVHRDLAARNILMHNGEPKISDFGMSRIIKEETQAGKTTTSIGPIRWMAPESIANQTYSFKSDVWMFGIILFEISARQEPHIGEDILNTGIKIRDLGMTPTIPNDCPLLLREVMEMCWITDPYMRPTMEQLCQKLDEHAEL